MSSAKKVDASSKVRACRVLLVEDDVADRRRLTGLMEARGYTVHAMADGQQALDYLHSFPPPAAVLLDLVTPVLDGAAFRRAQRQDPALAGIPVLVMAAPDEVTPALSAALGDVTFLRKPVRGEPLFAALAGFSDGKRPELLLVEDEPAILRMLEITLSHHGFFVREAGGGSEAIAVFERHRGTIDVVLLDVQMPEIDGPQTLTVLRALDPEVGVIFMSGNTGDYSSEELLRRGARYVLQKPFRSIAELIRLLYQVSQRPDRSTIAPSAPPHPEADEPQ